MPAATETIHTATDWVGGFEYADIAATLKTAWLVDDGPSNLALIVDWDGVVTAKHYDGVSGTSWDVLRRHMTTQTQDPNDPDSEPVDRPAEHRKLYELYGPLEKRGLLTAEQSERWQRDAMALLTGSSLLRIERDARRTARLQPGVQDLFHLCDQANVPIFVKSSGVAQVINAIASQYGVSPTKVFSNEFSVDDQGVITGVDEQTLTHSLNKHAYSHLNVDGHETRHHTIVIGDNLHDADMIEETDNLTLRIRVGEDRDDYIQRHGMAGWRELVGESFDAGYDLVAVQHGLLGVLGLTRAIAVRQYNLAAAA